MAENNIEKEIQALVLNEFLTKNDNSVPAISKRLGIDKYKVHKILNKYLDGKKSKVE